MVEAQFEPRRTPGNGAGWFEAHLTLATGPQGSVVIWSSIHPDRDHAEQACVVWPAGGKPVVMIEADIPIPAKRWEFRTSALWVEQVCESPHEHWSYGLEAFALELDDSTELIRTGFGTRVPLGWELDFYGSTAPRWLLTGAQPLEQAGAYTQAGSLTGILLDADGQHPWDGSGQRWHWWGTEPLSGAGLRRRDVPASPPEQLHLPLTQGVVIVTRDDAGLGLVSAPALDG